MAHAKLFLERQPRHPRSRKALEKVALWERKFQEAKSWAGQYRAMMQLRRWASEEHPIVQMWERREGVFSPPELP